MSGLASSAAEDMGSVLLDFRAVVSSWSLFSTRRGGHDNSGAAAYGHISHFNYCRLRMEFLVRKFIAFGDVNYLVNLVIWQGYAL